jgi:cathepsin L
MRASALAMFLVAVAVTSSEPMVSVAEAVEPKQFPSLVAVGDHQTASGAEATDRFEMFLHRNSKSYPKNSDEYRKRRDIFFRRVEEIDAHNARPGRLWTAALNRFADLTDEELALMRGWRHLGGSTRRQVGGGAGGASLLQQEDVSPQRYPEDVSWQNLSMARNIYDQGSCGSCWAVTTASVLEAHHEIAHGKSRTFSVQELVNCVPNPKHCGGKGGCDGATVELGMNWAMSNGLATEAMDPYETRETECSKTVALSLGEGELDGDGRILATPSLHEAGRGGAAAFGLTGFWTLEKNKEAPLIQAVVEHGPVAVSVSAESWFSYHSGVFNGCPKNSVVDHAVTLFGYGNAGQSHRYWLIRNSWGPDWGESGFIRLLRHEDEESHCGIDDKPKLGVACDGAPEQVTVCGSCGILYDSVIPRFQKSREAATSLSDETEVTTGETESSTESESEEPASMLQQAADEKEGQEEPDDRAGRSMLQGKETDAAGSGDALNVTVASAALKSVQASGEVSAAAAKLSPSQARMAASIKAKAYEAAGYEVQADGTLHKSSKAKATPSNLMRRDAAR